MPATDMITRKHDEVGVEFVELSGAGGYEPGSILRRLVKRLSLADWEEFDRLVTRSGFWHQPAEDESSEIGADGAQWIIEGRRGNAYHLVDRWSPKDGDHRAIGLFFLERAGYPPSAN